MSIHTESVIFTRIFQRRWHSLIRVRIEDFSNETSVTTAHCWANFSVPPVLRAHWIWRMVQRAPWKIYVRCVSQTLAQLERHRHQRSVSVYSMQMRRHWFAPIKASVPLSDWIRRAFLKNHCYHDYRWNWSAEWNNNWFSCHPWWNRGCRR